MRVKNFDDPVSMADGTLKTLAGMGGDSGGGAPVAGLTLEEFNVDDDLPRELTHDGILILVHDDVDNTTPIFVQVPRVKTFRFDMAKNTMFVCPVKEGTHVEAVGSDPRNNITLLYYH